MPGKKRQKQRNVYGWLSVILLLVCWAVWGASKAWGDQTSSGTASGTENRSALATEAARLVRQGVELQSRHDLAGAEAAFRKAIEAHPTSGTAHLELGLLLWQEGNVATAWKELRVAAQLDPASATIHHALGKLAWSLYLRPSARSGKAQNLTPEDFQALALSEVEKAVALAPHNFNMRLDLAELNLAVGRDKHAQTQAEQAIQLATSSQERSLAHVTMARALFATDDEDRAELEYKKALEENPTNGAAYLNLGHLRLFQHKPLDAARFFRDAIRVSPALEPAYAALAQLLANAHQQAEARALFEEAVALDPDDWHSRYNLARLLMEAGDSARAKEILVRIVAQQAEFLPAREQLALLLLRQGDQEGALEQAQALIARDPQAMEGHRVLALLLWRKRKMEASLAECALALAAEPHSISMLALQAIELWMEKQKQGAQAAFRQAARLDPSVASGTTFCRLILCNSQDILIVNEFLRKNRWVLNPAEPR